MQAYAGCFEKVTAALGSLIRFFYLENTKGEDGNYKGRFMERELSTGKPMITNDPQQYFNDLNGRSVYIDRRGGLFISIHDGQEKGIPFIETPCFVN
ncbi:MAG: hypothetical protein MZV64_34705 [Ignavibacteriales bacterium]|nr:hypothetical protein [Ignavibacteriales bacterium]